MAKDKQSKKTESGKLGGLFSDFNEIGSTIVSVLKWAVKGNRVTSEKLHNLIDTGFTSLIDTVQNIRRRLLEIDYECRDGEFDRVVQHLRELGLLSEWEQQEREMRMCRAFREFRDLLHGVFSGGIDEKRRSELLATVDSMILTGEDRMADYLSGRLTELSSLGKKLETKKLTLDDIRSSIAQYTQDLTDLRLSLMKQERKARDLLASQ